MGSSNRRHFIRTGVVGSLAFQVAGATQWLTPREAHAAEVSLEHLDAAQARLLGHFCDHVLPGAIDAGVVEFVDHQLGEIPNECLLMCKYFPGINAPYRQFYAGGLAALEAFTRSRFQTTFAELDHARKDALVKDLWEGKAEPWDGPPPPFFYMMLRSDAVDVCYGTEQGFDRLQIPYLAHIRPPADWSGTS